MIDIAEGRRLMAAAEEALIETVYAWDRWVDANINALLDAAERTEAAESRKI